MKITMMRLLILKKILSITLKLIQIHLLYKNNKQIKLLIKQ